MGIQRTGQSCREAGFTLIETIVVLVVASVLLCVAVPALGGLLARQRLVSAQLDLVASLNHARGLAIVSRRRALFCPSSGGQQCTADTHWERGWVIGNYRVGNASQLDGPPQRVNDGYAGLVITSTTGRTGIRFQPNGNADGGNVTFTLCRPGHTEDALAITVSRVGRIASAKVSADYVARCASGG